MSTAPPLPAPSSPGVPPPAAKGPREIKLVSHSPIFYWWPIWVLGYVLAVITWMDGTRLAILPSPKDVPIKVYADNEKPSPEFAQYKVTVAKPVTGSLESAAAASQDPTNPPAFKTRVSERAWMGPVFCVVLLLTILITNVPLRGLWSFLVILLLIVTALAFTVFEVWDSLLGALGHLHIYMNMTAYVFIATVVLFLWIVSVFIFDQRTYMVVTPGQIRVCEHIGASIRNFDTTGMSFEKQRDDLFRHWILGFFSGDLIVRTHGAEKEEIRFPNVLWIGWRLEQVQEILRERATVINP
jgi:hypothetical protein